MLNIESLTTNKHPFIRDVEEIFGHSYPDIDSYVNGANHPSILDDGYDQYFLSNLFKKVENVDIGLDPAAKTIREFKSRVIEQIDENEILALRLRNVTGDSNFDRTMLHARAFIHRCFSSFRGAVITPRFTFGATIECKRGASIFERMKNIDHYSKAVTDMMWAGLEDHVPARSLCDYPMINTEIPYDNSKLTVEIRTVWKTALGSRIIGLHNSGIMPIQNGFGDYIKNVILPRYCNIVIETAQDTHRALAHEYSLTGEYATSDQRNASNNILRALVEYLFPKDVFRFMSCITPRVLIIDGEEFETTMMCPQGNGYIFPLQTLVFYALLHGIQKTMGLTHRIYVYGDDVICHRDVFKAFNNLLHLLFMEPNLDKSYCDDLIRESCGADYVYGLNVRALYVNNLPTTTQEWIILANGIRRIGFYNNGGNWRSMRYLLLWVRVVHRIPEGERVFCPRLYGDAGINFESTKRYTISYDFKSYNVPHLRGNRWEKYPNGGFNSEGYPYSAERIKAYTARRSSQRGTTVIDELKGLPTHVVLRMLNDPSLSKTGFTLYREDKNTHLEQFYANGCKNPLPKGVKSGYYPLSFNLDDAGYHTQWIPYTHYNQGPEDIDSLFSFITENSGNYITKTDDALQMYENKRLCRLRDLKDVLIRIVRKRDLLAKRAIISEDIF